MYSCKHYSFFISFIYRTIYFCRKYFYITSYNSDKDLSRSGVDFVDATRLLRSLLF
ncbi:hypothetical protein BBOMB_0327 [Bifidobacterium bombi DSM 19703]|uniref:Uncharacterized protein n=1 Tax=Bifidobacterium bombi DSM 19703 TaxID=1341695 RepID=A0A080N244_9BIFI|nr:hypothetical protein BBOMB_0327 [Bifidobacterium bombi DSM 19703]